MLWSAIKNAFARGWHCIFDAPPPVPIFPLLTGEIELRNHGGYWSTRFSQRSIIFCQKVTYKNHFPHNRLVINQKQKDYAVVTIGRARGRYAEQARGFGKRAEGDRSG
jgi:hypothetical protein